MENKCYDVLLLQIINSNRDIYKLIVQDRLMSEIPRELDYNDVVTLTKSFIRVNNVIQNAKEWGISDSTIELMIEFNNKEDAVPISEYEAMLTSLRYHGFTIIIIGRTDVEVIDDEVGDFDVKSYVLDNLTENVPGTTNFYTGIGRSYLNAGGGLYPYAIDYCNDIGLSPEEMEDFDINASFDSYNALREINELQTFNDDFARSVIKAKRLEFIRITTV